MAKENMSIEAGRALVKALHAAHIHGSKIVARTGKELAAVDIDAMLIADDKTKIAAAEEMMGQVNDALQIAQTHAQAASIQLAQDTSELNILRATTIPSDNANIQAANDQLVARQTELKAAQDKLAADTAEASKIAITWLNAQDTLEADKASLANLKEAAISAEAKAQETSSSYKSAMEARDAAIAQLELDIAQREADLGAMQDTNPTPPGNPLPADVTAILQGAVVQAGKLLGTKLVNVLVTVNDSAGNSLYYDPVGAGDAAIEADHANIALREAECVAAHDADDLALTALADSKAAVIEAEDKVVASTASLAEAAAANDAAQALVGSDDASVHELQHAVTNDEEALLAAQDKLAGDTASLEALQTKIDSTDHDAIAAAALEVQAAMEAVAVVAKSLADYQVLLAADEALLAEDAFVEPVDPAAEERPEPSPESEDEEEVAPVDEGTVGADDELPAVPASTNDEPADPVDEGTVGADDELPAVPASTNDEPAAPVAEEEVPAAPAVDEPAAPVAEEEVPAAPASTNDEPAAPVDNELPAVPAVPDAEDEEGASTNDEPAVPAAPVAEEEAGTSTNVEPAAPVDNELPAVPAVPVAEEEAGASTNVDPAVEEVLPLGADGGFPI